MPRDPSWSEGTEGFDALVREAQAGSRQAMDQVLENLRPFIEALSRKYADPAKPVQSTSDLLQESCLRAWRRIGTLRGGTEDEATFAMFRSWIGQIVERLGLDAIKARDVRFREVEVDGCNKPKRKRRRLPLVLQQARRSSTPGKAHPWRRKGKFPGSRRTNGASTAAKGAKRTRRPAASSASGGRT